MEQTKAQTETSAASKKATQTRFVHLGAGFFLDRNTGQVVAL